MQELSLLSVLPLLISFGTGGSSKSLPVDSSLDAAGKTAPDPAAAAVGGALPMLACSLHDRDRALDYACWLWP